MNHSKRIGSRLLPPALFAFAAVFWLQSGLRHDTVKMLCYSCFYIRRLWILHGGKEYSCAALRRAYVGDYINRRKK